MQTILSRPVLVFDFGGTKLTAAVIQPANGEIIAHQRVATPAQGGATTSLKTIIKAGKQVLNDLQLDTNSIEAVGISFGGPVSKDRRRVIRSMHVGDWEWMDLPGQFEAVFDKPAFMDNDANAAALGEWVFGAGKNCQNMLYVQVSTGIGAGLILQNQLYRGAGLAGEFGHMTLSLDGPLCVCGRRGCLESLSSGWAIAREGRDVFYDSSILRTLCKNETNDSSAETVFKAYRMDDPWAEEILQRSLSWLALGIANLVMLLDPEMVIIGGGVARANDVISPIVESALAEFLPDIFQARSRVEFATLGGDETLIGAALLTQGH